jgi:lysozyme
MPNETMQMSPGGRTALRQRERAVLSYYNDAANNCTYGVGTLAHRGPCTEDELRRPVTETDIHVQMTMRVSTAEAAVRRQVSEHALTQEQFDALVSFTYNVGARGAGATLRAANGGDMANVVRHMNSNVYIHPVGADGRRGQSVRSRGLVNRRQHETAPFQAAEQPRPR